jgi:TolA-binding protein
MNALFLVICGVSVVFFVLFLFECSRPLRRGQKSLAVRKTTGAAAVDSATGGRFFAHLEKQMAEFLAAHSRTAALLLLTASLLVAIPAHAQRTPPPPAPSETEQAVPPAVQKQLDAMQKRIDQLETELANRKAQEQSAEDEKMQSHAVAEQPSAPPAEGAKQMATAPGKPAKPEPFSFADFTWLNGNSRVKEVPFQNAFFTPEIRADIDYIYDFNHPRTTPLAAPARSSAPTNFR